MGKILAILLSIGAAGLPAALAFAVYETATNSATYFLPSFFLAGVFASTHALVLGVPVALILAHTRLFRPSLMAVAGAIVGVLPLAVFTGLNPPHYWQNPLLMFSSFSLLGAVGALTLYFTYRALSPNNSFKPKPLRGSA